VALIVLDQLDNRQELQRLNEPKLAILMKDLYQLIAAAFPVNNKSRLQNLRPVLPELLSW